MSPIKKIQSDYGIVGREEELAMALAILGADRHLLLEGPVGVGKTTVALAVCRHLGRKTIRIDGDERYTESKLAGWFDPPLVIRDGYNENSFFSGPLTQAMRGGQVLFINELNRMPESVQNILLPALDEKLVILPRIGEVHGAQGFQVIATQNPVEYIATGHLSEALKDRFEHVALDYQSVEEEIEIVSRETGCKDELLVRSAVEITRETRSHPRIKKGASVRAAIAITAIAQRLEGEDALRRAALAALQTRIEFKDDAPAGLSRVVDEICDRVKKNSNPDLT